jgi:hypothetical protein
MNKGRPVPEEPSECEAGEENSLSRHYLEIITYFVDILPR